MKRSHLIFALVMLGAGILDVVGLQLIAFIVIGVWAAYVIRAKIKARKLDRQIKTAV